MKNVKAITHFDIKGKDWIYHGNQYHVLAVENNGLTIVTNRHRFTFATEEEREYFLAELAPATQIPPVVHSNVISFQADASSSDLFMQMLGEMKGDFDKIKEDEGYIPRAAARCKQVKAMTEFVKTRIALEVHNANIGARR